MFNLAHLRKRLGALLVVLALALTATAVLAVPPPASGLGVANGYGTVTWEKVSPNAEEQAAGMTVCYRFIVTNTQQPLANPSKYQPLKSLPPSGPVQGFGIKGLVVYSPDPPAMISSTDRTSTTLYQDKNNYSWWDHNGSEDLDGNGLQDRITEPQETNTGSNSGYTDRQNLYRLCYTHEIDPTEYVIGLHIVEPFSQETFFAFGDTPSLSLVKSVNTQCVRAGTPVTYQFTVKNTSTVTVTNITITDDKLGLIGTVASLAPGASQTLSMSTALMQTTTNVAQAVGSAGTATATATSNPVTVQVYHPGIDVDMSVSPTSACAGDQVIFTATVKNTGDVPLTGVVLQFSDGVNISVGTLNLGATAGPFTRVVTIPANQPAGTAFVLSVNAAGTATVCGTSSTARDSASATVQVTPCAAIRGVAYCIHDQNVTVNGATVQLRQGGSTVKTVVSGPDGKFTFPQPITDGSYTVRILATDYQTYDSAPFNYVHDGSDIVLSAGLQPLPINFLAQEQLSGRVFFSDVQSFRDREQAPVLGAADLSNPAYANPAVSHRFVGTIPGFPGHYGGIGEPEVWVIIQEPLLGENAWNGYSFTNLIAVEDGIGTGAGRPRSVYTVTTLFSQPFTGPGTAHNYSIMGLEVYSTPSDGSFPVDPSPTWNTPPTLLQIGPSPVAVPAPGDVPPGWMAKTRFTYRFKPGFFTVYANGSYNDVCGEWFAFHLHPDGETP